MKTETHDAMAYFSKALVRFSEALADLLCVYIQNNIGFGLYGKLFAMSMKETENKPVPSEGKGFC